MKTSILSIIITLFSLPSLAQVDRTDEVRNMGPTFDYQGKIIRDVEIPRKTGAAYSFCHNKELYIDIDGLSADEKNRVTQIYIDEVVNIKDYIISQLDQAVETSNLIFLETVPEFAPTLLELYRLKEVRKYYSSKKYKDRTAQERKESRSLYWKIREIEKELYGVWNRGEKKLEGGVITPLDNQRKIIDYKTIRWFDKNAIETLQKRDYSRVSSFHDRIKLWFRIQGALTIGDLKTGILNTGQFGDNVKSEYISTIERYVSDLLSLPIERVQIKGTKNNFEKSDFCQKNNMSFFDL